MECMDVTLELIVVVDVDVVVVVVVVVAVVDMLMEVVVVAVVEVVTVVVVERLSLLVILLVKITIEIPSSVGARALFRWHLVHCSTQYDLRLDGLTFSRATSPCRSTPLFSRCNQCFLLPNTGGGEGSIMFKLKHWQQRIGRISPYPTCRVS